MLFFGQRHRSAPTAYFNIGHVGVDRCVDPCLVKLQWCNFHNFTLSLPHPLYPLQNRQPTIQ
jgi:hypothetical protein